MNQRSSQAEPFLPIEFPVVAGYRIRGLLGVGGMASVWHAVHLASHREVALKLLDADALASPQARARFQREVRVTGMLHHRHIARLRDAGECGDIAYYATELIDGLPLDVYVRQRRLNRGQILRLFATVCRAVHYAHQRGVVHLDLKPSNILVDAAGEPHLLDFGLAEALSAGEPCGLAAGEVAGTPEFMSPEQASPQRGRIDARSDIYTLGTILFLLLTGHTPHDASGSCARVLRRIRTQRPRRPRDLDPTIDRGLESLLLCALEKDPALRPQTAAQLAQLLEGQTQASAPLRRKIVRHLGEKIARPLRGRSDKARILALALTAVLAGPLRPLLH